MCNGLYHFLPSDMRAVSSALATPKKEPDGVLSNGAASERGTGSLPRASSAGRSSPAMSLAGGAGTRTLR